MAEWMQIGRAEPSNQASTLTLAGVRLVLEPGERLAEQDGRAGRAGGERAQGLVDDGPPLDPAIEGRADQVDATPGDPDRLAVGIDAEGVVGIAAGPSLRLKMLPSRRKAGRGRPPRR